MKKIVLNIVLLILWLILVAFLFDSVVYAQLKPYAFPFIGKWQPAEDPLLIEEYGFQDIQNLRKDGKRLRGVSGHTKINTAPFYSVYDYTDFTETDGSSRVTVAAQTITVADLDSDEDAYVYYDHTANYWDEDFEFWVDFKITEAKGDCGIWALTNNVDGIYGLMNGDLDHLALYYRRLPGKRLNIDDDPSNTGRDAAFDNDGSHLAVAHYNSPYVTIYDTSDWTKLSDPSALPTGNGISCAFNHNGSLLAIAHNTSPYITIYNTSDWSKVSNPSTLPSGHAKGVAFNNDGSLMAVAHSDSPYVTIYNTSDWSKVTNPATLPTGTGRDVAFSHDGTYLAVAHDSSPYVTIYNTSTWAKLADPGTLPAGNGNGVAWNEDSSYMAVAHVTSPYVTIYDTSTWAKLSDPATLPTGTGNGVGFYDNFLAVSHGSSPYLTVYDTAEWNKFNDPETPPTLTGYGLAFDDNGNYLYLAVAHQGGANLSVYRGGALVLQETNGSANKEDSGIDIELNTTYYLEIWRDDDAGSYGALYCRIWSDPQRWTLLDTVGVTLTEQQDFRYVFGMTSWDGTGTGNEFSGTISNLTAYPHWNVKNGFQFIKDQPAETHMFVQSLDSDGNRALFHNSTAIPSQGNFDITGEPFYLEASGAGLGRFSIAPQGEMIFCNGEESLIWGGDEKKINSLFVCSDASNSNPQDYTEAAQNTLQTAGNFVTIGGGNDASTVLLLHCEGADGSTTFTDSSATPHTPVAGNDAQIDTDQDKFGTASALFDGDNDYIDVPDHADWFMDTGEFTIDCWVRFNTMAAATIIGIFRQRVDGNNYVLFYVKDNEIYFKIKSGGVDTVIVGGDTKVDLTTNKWYHLAIIRGWGGSANSWAITLDGTLIDTAITDSDPWSDLAANFQIGRYDSGTELDGWIDEFRVSKGVARWTSNFTVASRPYKSSDLYWVVGSTRPIQGVKFYILNSNEQTSTLSANEWTGSAWSSLSITDGTASGGVSLAQTGSVTFSSTVETSRPTVISGEYLFWYQFQLSAGDADIYYITLDAPMQNIVDIWDATPIGSLQFQVYDGGQWEDYSEEVTVETTVDYETNPMAAELDDLTNTEYIYIAFPERISAIKFNMTSHVNTNAATVTVYYWDGSAWVSVGSITDDTAESGVSLAKSGYIFWNPPERGEEFPRNLFGLHSSWVTKKIISVQEQLGRPASSPLPIGWEGRLTINGRTPTPQTVFTSHSKTTEVPPGYYYKIMWSATLSTDVLVDTVSGIRAQEINAIPGYKFPLMFQGRSFLCSETSGEKNKCIYCMFEAPDVWNGVDSGALYFGDDTELTAGAILYNIYRTSGFEQAIFTKRNETYRVFGDGPDNWILDQVSSNIGCPAPLTMQICDVGQFTENEQKNVAIWQSDTGVVMCDGATIIDISEDIKCYWDPNDYRCIASDRIDDSEATYDPDLHVYKLLITSGAGQTRHNTELEYCLEYNEWTKIYRKNTSGANPLQCSFQVHDTYGNSYLYGATQEGYLYRLENGTNWDGTAITQYVWTKDILIDDNKPMFNQTIVELFRLMFETKTTTSQDMAITHYCDGTVTTDGSDNQVVPDAIDMDDGPYDSQDCMLGRCLRHSFKISTDISDVTDGMELTGMGLLYESFDIIED